MKFYGQFSNPRVDEYLYNTFFKNKQNGFFIECGAFDGITESSCKVFDDIGWDGINIEAIPSEFLKLKNNRPNNTNLNIGLCGLEECGQIKKFFTVQRTDGSHLGWGGFHNEEKLKEISRHNVFIKSVDIKTLSFPTLIKNYINDKTIDLFVLDVEGYELEVLKGLVTSSSLPKVLCIEFPQVGLHNISNIVTSVGYKYHSIKHNNVHFTL